MAKKRNEPIQISLFGNDTTQSTPKRQAMPSPINLNGERLDLKTPPKEDLDEVVWHLNNKHDKEELEKMAKALRPILKDKLVMCRRSNGKEEVCDDVIPLLTDNNRKQSTAKAIAFMVTEPSNLQLYIDSLSKEMKELWSEILISLYMSERTAQEILNTKEPIFSANSSWSYYTRTFVQKGFEFFCTVRSFQASMDGNYYRKYETFISVNPIFYKYFLTAFHPEAFDQGNSLAELPDSSLKTFDFEVESVRRYPLTASLLKTGKIAMGAKTANAADIKRAAKQIGLNEFFESNSSYANMRSKYYIEMLTLEYHLYTPKRKKKNETEVSYQDILRNLFDNLSNIYSQLPGLLLPHIKGLRKQMTDFHRLDELFTDLCEWMAEESERWVPIDEVLLKSLALEDYSEPERYDAMVFNPGYQKSEIRLENEFSHKDISIEHFTDEFGLTALKASAFMLCSLGIAEVAIADEIAPSSPFSSLRYLRLTPLGRYVLHVTNDYDAPEEEHVAYFELDTDRLVIRSLVEPNPYAQLLLDTSTAISRNRFETSPQSFLAHCMTQSDVEEKIDIFRQFVSNELPPLWKQFFDSLLKHCNPLKPDKTSYLRYHIDPANTDLVQLLASDAKLRQLVTRAEGYLLLVKKDDLKKFTEELKKHGYLL